MIKVEGVEKSFAAKGEIPQKILRDISFNVNEGELVTLLGESGCGKSTLLHIIGGFLTSDEGQVFIDQKKVTNPVRTCVTLFQHHNLLPWRNVLDNVLIGLTGEQNEKRNKAIEMLKFVGLENNLDHFPDAISGGMKQRVAIARAFAMEPDVILMDEPFGALDTFNRYRLQDELIRLQMQENVSVLLVTHDIDEAVYLSDKIILLSANPGEIYETVPIDLPKPRNRSDEQFYRIRKKILETFKLSSEMKKPEYYI